MDRFDRDFKLLRYLSDADAVFKVVDNGSNRQTGPRRRGVPPCTPGLVSTKKQSDQSIVSIACIQESLSYGPTFPAPGMSPA